MPTAAHLEEELHLKDIIDMLRRRVDIIAIFFVVTVLAVALGSFIMQPVYRASATLLIDPESPNVLTTTGVVELQSQNYLSYKEYYQSQIEIITSPTLAKKVFDEFGLASQSEYRTAKEPIKKFLKTIRVEPIRDTRLLRLNVEGRDPKEAAGIANRIAELYVMRNLYYISKNELMNLLKNEYLKLEAKMSDYAKVYKDAHPEMIRLKNEMTDMVGKIEQEKRSVYDYEVIEQYLKHDSHALSGFKANNVSIQDAAEVPATPVRPKRLTNIILAVIIGLVGGVILAFFFDYLDDSARTIEDIERVAPWPFLAQVPVIDPKLGGKDAVKDLIVHLEPKDPIAEAYRSIRTRALFASTEERPLRTILVTSPGPQEGKTTTFCNIACTLAQNNRRVLLVDADMRKPRIHEVFKQENMYGLSNYLSGQCGIRDVVRKTSIPNISVISGGAQPPNPSELLASNRLKELITEAHAAFDFVLFDSPPVALLTDAVIVSRVVDGVIMVIESGKTSKRTLKRIYSLFEDAKARVIGMVLNRAQLNRADTYYYSYYYGKQR